MAVVYDGIEKKEAMGMKRYPLLKIGLLAWCLSLAPIGEAAGALDFFQSSAPQNDLANSILPVDTAFEFLGFVQGSVLDFPAKAFEWIKTLFSDPTTALKQLWEGIMAIVPGAVGAATTLIDIVWWPVNQFIDWVTKKLGWRSEDAPNFNLRESITGWVTDFWNWFTSWLPDINKIANSLVEKVRSILPDWVVDNVGINYTQSGNDRTRTDMMENDDAVMRQQVIGGPQKTYTTRADIAQALSFNYDAYKSMNEGGDPYARQLPAAPIIIQDNSRSSGGTAQLFMNNDASSTDTSYYQRRLSMGLGV